MTNMSAHSPEVLKSLTYRGIQATNVRIRQNEKQSGWVLALQPEAGPQVLTS